MTDFYLDHNVHRHVGAGLRAAGCGIVAAQEWGYAELADDRQLWVATRARRVLLTHDSDLRRIHREWANRKGLVRELTEHSGMVVAPAFPAWSIERIVREVMAIVGQRPSFVGACYEWSGGAWVRMEREGDGDGR